MEKIEGMNLEEWMQKRNDVPIVEKAAIRWLKQLVEILHTVHEKQYFHRDIKPPNIMLRPDGQLALIDFGTAREITQTFIQKLEGQKVTGIISLGYTQVRKNRQLLEDAMQKQGFVGLSTEWWHFDAPAWEDFPVMDVPFNQVRS